MHALVSTMVRDAQKHKVLVAVDPRTHANVKNTGVLLIEQRRIRAVLKGEFKMVVMRFQRMCQITFRSVTIAMLGGEIAMVCISFPAPSLVLFEICLVRIFVAWLVRRIMNHITVGNFLIVSGDVTHAVHPSLAPV